MTRVTRFGSGSLGLLVFCLATGSSAQGGFTAKFINADPGQGNYTYKARGTQHTSAAGRMNWTYTGSPSTLFDPFRELNGQTGNKFITFCIEVTQNVSGNTNYNIETKQLKDLPSSGSPSPMQTAKANDIAQFWGKWASQIASLLTSGSTNIAGFGSVSFDRLGSAIQLAIWEILYEKDGTAYNVNSEGGTGEGFKVTNGDGTARNLANHLLTNTDFTAANTTLANVIGLKVGNTNQDQVTIIDDDFTVGENGNPEPVPVPPAVVLALGGIVSGFCFRRRLAGKVVAA